MMTQSPKNKINLKKIKKNKDKKVEINIVKTEKRERERETTHTHTHTQQTNKQIKKERDTNKQTDKLNLADVIGLLILLLPMAYAYKTHKTTYRVYCENI